jgi:hypothetical protein
MTHLTPPASRPLRRIAVWMPRRGPRTFTSENVNPIWPHRGKAVSSDHRNRWRLGWTTKALKFAVRSLPRERLAGTPVELRGNGSQNLGRMDAEIGALWEILAQ